jgi:uncharacterized protein
MRTEKSVHLPIINIRLTTFFVVTFLLSWLIWTPLDLSHFGIGQFQIAESTSGIVRLLGVLIPSIVAMVLAARSKHGGIRILLSQLKVWRTGWRWWGAAAVVQPVILVITALVYNGWANKAITNVPWVSLSSFIVNVFFLFVATFGEEIGWRGLALPVLERRYTALKSSVILGFLWATWHVPFWLLLDTYTQFGVVYLVLNYLFVLSGTFYITWFYNHGRFSLLLPVIFHITFNIVNVAWLPVTSNLVAFGIVIVINLVIVFIILKRLEPAGMREKKELRI